MSRDVTINVNLSAAQIDAIARRLVSLRGWPDAMPDGEFRISLRAAQLHAEARARAAGEKPEQRPICAECFAYRVEPGLKVCGACLVDVKLQSREDRGYRQGWRAAAEFYGVEEGARPT